MAKRVASSWLRSASMIVLTVLGLVLAGSVLLEWASTHIIAEHAERTALAWAEYVGSELEPVQAVADGAPLSAEQRAFLQRVVHHGPVFRFKLFDRTGQLIIVSDDLESGAQPAQQNDDHNRNARSVAASGRPITAVKSGDGESDRPDVYAESYVPVISAGNVVAITEVYVDQTRAAIGTRWDFMLFGLVIVALTLVALAIPFTMLASMTGRIRRQNEILREEKERAQAAERAKAEFLANMSHELRTPLNAINGFSELLADETFGPLGNAEYKAYSQAINDSGRHLAALINDILDLSRIEAGTVELDEEVFDLAPVITSCTTMIAERAADRGVAVVVDIPESALPRLHADKTRIKQVLINLLSNAVKFTNAGGQVTVKTWHDGAGGLAIQVADTGIGIAASDIPKALARFQQVESGLDRKHEGTGLGLPLVKSFTELHGGTVNLQSQLGVGTTVTIRLPAARTILRAA